MTSINKTVATQQEKRERVSFSKIPQSMVLPNLISVQKESFEHFMTDGLAESFAEFSPIQNSAGTMEVTFSEHQFGDAPNSIAECRAKDISYQVPLFPLSSLTSALSTRRRARSRSSSSSWATSRS